MHRWTNFTNFNTKKKKFEKPNKKSLSNKTNQTKKPLKSKQNKKQYRKSLTLPITVWNSSRKRCWYFRAQKTSKGSIYHYSRKCQCKHCSLSACHGNTFQIGWPWPCRVAGAKEPSPFSQGPGDRAKIGGRGLFCLPKTFGFQFCKTSRI